VDASHERRADPRVRVGGAFLRLLSREPAHIRDVSAGGALLETGAAAVPGAEGHLATRLNSRPFSATVKVAHVRPPHGGEAGGRARVGVEFAAMDEDSRTALSRFLGTGDGSQA
jgi:hypothetical protein